MPSRIENGHDHRKLLIYNIMSAIQEEVPAIAEEVLKIAVERAPSVEEEYRELNAGEGEEPLVAMGSDGGSADTDGRRRFIKPINSYLKNAVGNLQENFQLGRKNRFWYTSLTMRFGRVSFLERMSHFKYRNLVAKGGTIENEVGPYFSMFEGGTAGAAVEDGITTFTVTPRGNYPLRPGEGPEGVRKTMIKSIRGRFMFAPNLMAAAARTAFQAVLARLGPGKLS